VELHKILDTLEPARAEVYLELRNSARQRVAALRAEHQSRLNGNPDIEKDLQAAEIGLADPTKAEMAVDEIENVAKRLADLGFQEGVNTPVLGVIVEENKFKYLFGKAAPDPHNVPRSTQNQRELERIGFSDDDESHAAIRAHLERVPYDPANIIATSPGREIASSKFPKQSAFSGYWGGPTETRQSLLYGPNGQVMIESTWEVRYGTRRLTTVIPKAPDKKTLLGGAPR